MGEPRLLDVVWRWLPLFQAVAEAQSITRAASVLGVTPPAVSRAVQQLEKDIGQALFDRRGKRLFLNPDGERLLRSVRAATAHIDGVLSELSDRDSATQVRIASIGQLARVFVTPLALRLNALAPDLTLSVVHLDPEEALAGVAGGALDFYLGLNVAVGEPLRAHLLADLDIGVYCGRGHPLWKAGRVVADVLVEHPFVAQRRTGMMRAVWPPLLKRRVTFETDSHAVALAACLQGSHLMVMEQPIAAPLLASGELREVQLQWTAATPAPTGKGLLPRAQLVLVHHEGALKRRVLAQVLTAITDVVAGCLKTKRSP